MMLRDFFNEYEQHFHMNITLDEYQAEAMNTAVYPGHLIYPLLGLQGEVGELSEKVKKYFRDTTGEMELDDPVVEMSAEFREDLAKEAGDVLWYLTALANDLGYDLEEIAAMNLKKLRDRKERGVIHGSGDER